MLLLPFLLTKADIPRKEILSVMRVGVLACYKGEAAVMTVGCY
jgi:hypothetical protein